MPIKYRPLDILAKKIRLLTLHPDEPGSSTRWSLIQYLHWEYSNVKEGIYKWKSGDTWTQNFDSVTGILSWKYRKFQPYKEIKGPLNKQSTNYDNSSRPPPSDLNISWVAAYEALSYTLGDLLTSKTIDVSGYQVDVPANLFSALRHLRYSDSDRSFMR